MIRSWGRCQRGALVAPWLPILLWAFSGCGGQLGAVQATSAAGHRLGSDEHVLAGLPAVCLEIASLSGATDDCGALRDQARAWTHVVGQIEAYAAALSLHAGHHRGAISAAMVSGGPAAGASTGLTGEQSAAATALAGATRDLLTHRDDAALRKAIGDADAPIQLLVKAMQASIDQRIASIDFAETSVDVVGQSSGRPAPARAAETSTAPTGKKLDKAAATARDAEFELIRPTLEAVGAQLAALREGMARQAVANQAAVPGSFAGLAAVLNDLETKRERFEDLRDTLLVFAKAHHALHEGVDQLDTDALLAKVLGILGEASAPAAAPKADPHRPT